MSNPFSEYKDEAQLQQIKDNDSMLAFEVLYNRYWKKLLTEAKFQTGSQQEAEEIVQQSFLNIWKLRKELVIQHCFYTYVAAAVKYGILESITRRKTQTQLRDSLSQTFAATDNHTIEWPDRESIKKELEQTIQKLPQNAGWY